MAELVNDGTRLVRRAIGVGRRRQSAGSLGAALDASAEAYAYVIRWRAGAARRLATGGATLGARFTAQVAEALERLGWSVAGPEKSLNGDHCLIGEDARGTRSLVECPLGEQGVVEVEAVYAALAGRDAWGCDRCLVVAPGGTRFTHAVQDYARGAEVSLMRLLPSGELVRLTS